MYRLLETLQTAPDFASATSALLQRCATTTREALAGSDFDGVVLRAMLHLRPGAGYAGLYVVEGAGAELSAQVDGALLPSATAWDLVVSTRRPVAVDVVARTLRAADGATHPARWREPSLGAGSHQRLLKRGATHLFVLPVLAAEGPVGLVSVEVACVDGSLHPTFVWPDCSAALELGVALAVPYLLGLPREERATVATDELLPVVGATMAPIVRVLRAFAGEEETLLVHGETGSGKSRIARWCHVHSQRAGGPFEVLDLLSVPEETQLGELFGWKRGACTGAVSDHAGFVGRADGGTLFLDEVDKLSLKAQAALLTLIEERRYRALGDQQQRRADVRFIVGTNIDLARAVGEGHFREDLYYRLNVLPMSLPPLRERTDEIPAWARYMAQRRQREKGREGEVRFAEDALLELQRRPWPGNLRELDNVLRRALALAAIDGTDPPVVEARHLGPPPRRGPASVGVAEQLQSAAQALVGAALTDLDLRDVELAGALHGFVLAAAVERLDSREDAFRTLARGELVSARNHHRVLKREVTRAATLCDRLGEALPAAVAEVAADFDRKS